HRTPERVWERGKVPDFPRVRECVIDGCTRASRIVEGARGRGSPSTHHAARELASAEQSRGDLLLTRQRKRRLRPHGSSKCSSIDSGWAVAACSSRTLPREMRTPNLNGSMPRSRSSTPGYHPRAG